MDSSRLDCRHSTIDTRHFQHQHPQLRPLPVRTRSRVWPQLAKPSSMPGNEHERRIHVFLSAIGRSAGSAEIAQVARSLTGLESCRLTRRYRIGLSTDRASLPCCRPVRRTSASNGAHPTRRHDCRWRFADYRRHGDRHRARPSLVGASSRRRPRKIELSGERS